MILAFDVSRERRELVESFLADTHERSKVYPMNVILTFSFTLKEVARRQDLVCLVVLQTSLFNFLPSGFFKAIIRKGLRKAGLKEKVVFMSVSEALRAIAEV